jgi:WW domain
MNGVNGHTGSPNLWQEARNSDGRIYYYNTITKATQWTKPEELMTPVEASLISFRVYIVLVLTLILACIGRSAMEGIYSRRWPEVLV